MEPRFKPLGLGLALSCLALRHSPQMTSGSLASLAPEPSRRLLGGFQQRWLHALHGQISQATNSYPASRYPLAGSTLFFLDTPSNCTTTGLPECWTSEADAV